LSSKIIKGVLPLSTIYPDKRVKRTVENFKAALLELMKKKSFQDITITEIVHAADYNRGTFYAHYKCKEELLDEIIEDMFELMDEAYKKPYEHLSIIDFHKLSANAIVLFDHFLEHKEFYKLMLSPETNYSFKEKMINRLDQLFRSEFEFFTDDVDSDIDINLFSTYRIHGIIGILLQWIDSDFQEQSDYMGKQLIHILRFSTPTVSVKK